MRGALLRKISLSAGCFPPWSGFVVSLTGIIWFGIPCAAAGQEGRAARLGFAFDQRAHDAAVAAAQVGSEHAIRGSDVPSDDVIHLPRYYVTEQRMPFTTREILSPAGSLAVAKKRYISPVYAKTLGPLSAVASLIMNPLGGWQPNGPEAMALYQDAEQKRRNNDMRDLLQLDAAGR